MKEDNRGKTIFTDGKYFIDKMENGKYELTYYEKVIRTKNTIEEILKEYQKKVYQ